MLPIIHEEACELRDLATRLDALSPEEIGDFYTRRQALNTLWRDFCQQTDKAIIEIITERRQDVPIQSAMGVRRLYVSPEKKYVCEQPTATLSALMVATGGDIEAVAGSLSSGAFKVGACRKHLGDDFDRHFTMTLTPDLKEGAGLKKVLKVTKEGEDE
ncbi:MAG: hypothetical protein IPK85_03390 [Gemmatimonadetes bacterium]|nr:hypothetical protein [Gemmatimonadota bacterium]